MNTPKSLYKWMLIPMVFMQLEIFKDYWVDFCIKSIIHRKQIANHIWWLTSTLFIIIISALGKGIQSIQIELMLEQCSNVNIMISLYVIEGLILTMLFLCTWKYDKLKRHATWLTVGVNKFNFFGINREIGSSTRAFIKINY